MPEPRQKTDRKPTNPAFSGKGQKADIPPALMIEAFSELQLAHEELRIAEEELRVQNEALADAALLSEAGQQRYQDLFLAAPEPSLITDRSGRIEESNAAFSALLGVGPRRLKGRMLSSYVAPNSRHQFHVQMLEQKQAGESWLYLYTKQAGLLYASLHMSVLFDIQGQPTGLRWLVRGVTPDPGAEMERTRRLMTEVRDFAILTLDDRGCITSWNRGAESIFGYSAAEARGRPVDIIFTPEEQAAGVPARERMQAEATGRGEDDRWLVRKDGTRLWASGLLIALPKETDGPLWYAKIVRDQTQAHLREQREHAVSLYLQEAAQPSVPANAPGLAVRSFYRPAFADLSIGGDFYDVFGLKDGRTALVVGDVSGKGLEAAAQATVVRNMLRFALYNGRTLSGAITALNRTLAEQGLLRGFVTLFVGMFAPETGVLTYVNCGQEPALVRRAREGRVESLPHTGPLLGLLFTPAEFIGMAFTEEQVRLQAGDAVTIFTDGLTDMGPTHAQMLGIEGVTQLLQAPFSDTDAGDIADRIVARLSATVDAQGAGNVPDDVCVLVVVADAAPGHE